MNFLGLHFLRPWWLLALLPWLIASWRFYQTRHPTQLWQTVCDKALLPHLLIEQPSLRQYSASLLASIISLLLLLALSGPAWQPTLSPAFRSPTGIIYVVDMSNNLYTTDIKPSRLQRMQYKLIDLLNGNADLNVGMVAFAGEAYTVSPLTTDAQTIAAMLPNLTPDIMPIAGHNISMGLSLAEKLLQSSGAQPQNIVLVTASNPTAEAIDTARKLAAENIRVSVYSIGTTAGGPVLLPAGDFDDALNNKNSYLSRIDTLAMQTFAQAGHGIYIPFTDTPADTQQLLQYLQQQHSAANKKTQHSLWLWQDEGRWLILIVVLLASLAFRKPWFEELTQ